MTEPQQPYNEHKHHTAADKGAIKVAIIGGGLTGLLTATLLEDAFAKPHLQSIQITIFEKSRSVGRLATRYRTDKKTGKNWQWSFGAQFFTAKAASFQQFITPWITSKLIQPWQAQVVELYPADNAGQSPMIESKEQWDEQQARYISTPKMTSWGRQLAAELQQTTIEFKTRVAPLSQYSSLAKINPATDKQTELFDEEGRSLGLFDWMICTAPNGQAAELMAATGFVAQNKILKPEMLACYTLMLGWDDQSKLPDSLNNPNNDHSNPQASGEHSRWDVAYVQESIIDRIFIEHNKPNHPKLLPSLTIHADNDWSQQQVNQDIEEMTAQLLAEAKQALSWTEQTAPTQIDCHRWRYAATLMPLDIEGDEHSLGILVDKEQQWIVSGDWCGQGNIESCYQVAQETVEVVMKAVLHQ